jgi:chromosome segregation ATPase
MRSHRQLFQIHLLSLLLMGVVMIQTTRGSPAVDNDAVLEAATAPLLRELETLKEQLDAFEMKHDTLEAATEQFRLQAKSLKGKLEEERKRYDILANEKRLLENQMGGRVEELVSKATMQFEEYKNEQATKHSILQETVRQLNQQLESSEKQQEIIIADLSAKLSDERNMVKQLERSKASLEESMKKERDILSDRLNDSEQQVKSLEQTLKATLADEKERDNLHQKELRMRIEEANRWEARIKELNVEKKDMFSHTTRIEAELVASRDMASNLQQRVALTQNQLLVAEETIQEFKTDLESTKAEKSNLQRIFQDSQQRLVAAEQQVQTLVEEVNKISSAYEDTKMQLDVELRRMNHTKAVSVELQKTMDENLELRNELRSLKKELNTTATVSSQCSQTSETIRLDYQKTVDENLELRNELRSLEKELNTTASLSSQCSQTLETIRLEYQKTMDENLVLRNELRLLEKELNTTASVSSQCSQTLETIRLDYQKTMDENLVLRNELRSLENQLNTATTISSQCSQTLETVRLEYQTTMDENLELRNKLGSLEKQLNTTATVSSQCSQTFETIRLEYDGLDRDLTRLRFLLAEKNIVLDQCESTLEEVKNRTTLLQQDLLTKDEHLVQSTTKYAELEAVALHHNKEFAELRSRYADLAADLEIVRRKRMEAQESADQSKAKLTTCQVKLQDVTERYEDMEGMALQQMKDLAESTSRMEELVKEIDTMNGRLNESQANVDLYSREVGHWFVSARSTFRWIDHWLYRILRVIVDSPGYVVKACKPSVDKLRLLVPILTRYWEEMLQFVSILIRKCQRLHGMLVDVFQWIIATMVRCVSATPLGKSTGFWAKGIKSTLVFLQNHSHLVVILLESIGCLLCMDFVLSSYLLRRRAQRKEKSPMEYGSLLRKAKNLQK